MWYLKFLNFWNLIGPKPNPDKIPPNLNFEAKIPKRPVGLFWDFFAGLLGQILTRLNVVYFYKCTKGDCALLPKSGYVGHTTTSLSRRITMHLQSGGPKTHTETDHETPLTRHDMTENTTILGTDSDKRRLSVLEAVLIREIDPSTNLQVNARGILHLYDCLRPGLINRRRLQ